MSQGGLLGPLAPPRWAAPKRQNFAELESCQAMVPHTGVPSGLRKFMRAGVWLRPLLYIPGVLANWLIIAPKAGEPADALELMLWSLPAALLGFVAFGLFYGSVIPWHFTAARAAGSGPGSGPRHPGWAFGWLIPLGNMVLPFLALRGLWAKTGQEKPPGSFAAAWAAFFVYGAAVFVGWISGVGTALQDAFDQPAGTATWPEVTTLSIALGAVQIVALLVFAASFIQFARQMEARLSVA